MVDSKPGAFDFVLLGVGASPYAPHPLCNDTHAQLLCGRGAFIQVEVQASRLKPGPLTCTYPVHQGRVAL